MIGRIRWRCGCGGWGWARSRGGGWGGGGVVDRSVAAVVGLLGVLKAGGGYVPLDRSYPLPRLGFMAADAGVAAVVGVEADRALARRVAPGVGFVAVPTGEDGTADLPSVATADSLAYVIYTSGSTGTPKGVAGSHRQIVASTAARWAYPDPGTDLMML